ncbi:winged helix family transcriptional regulator [Cohnella luojiensis]|uniref:Winged helix family transcriptional regulator n=1 Tax=Cohnella luojiensis TaxID=652876 RepID=A0A4Y8LUL9_9BACL|nr:winged helix family transcriptional regulator [Cohnella luojiensis]
MMDRLARYERLSGGGQKKEEIRIRGLLIDKASRRVFVNDKEVAFTTKEFDLLTYLASNPNRVFSKDQLFEQLWGMDSLGDIATVTVHIRKIREKIEIDPSNSQYIDTIWGAGYRFKV